MGTSRWRGPATLALLLAACGSGADDAAPANMSATVTAATVTAATVAPTAYCDDLADVARILDGGGSVADYNGLLVRIAAEAPTDHADTWGLMLRLSEESFSYENFNPAIDSLDRISAELNSMCPGFDRVIVDDDGRMRLQPAG